MVERSDTHQLVALPPDFIDLPQIVVMGIAALNAILQKLILRHGQT
ncbi:hypothetical protein [Pseudomonas paeninsulae]|nr:hypothetical protein [Pseudomonas sp. IT1137]